MVTFSIPRSSSKWSSTAFTADFRTRRGYRLSDIHIARYHRAIDRRPNHRVVEVGLGHRQSRGLLADLGLGLGNIRVRSAHRDVRGIISRCWLMMLFFVSCAARS